MNSYCYTINRFHEQTENIKWARTIINISTNKMKTR